MEFLIITASSTMHDEIEAQFKANKITGYTLFPVVYGAGTGGGKRLNDEIWPGQNITYFAAVTQAQSQALYAFAKAYRSRKLREGLKIFSLEMKDMI